MKKTEQTIEEVVKVAGLYPKLHAAKQKIGKVVKNANNPHFKKSYADINAILETVEPILLEHGLLLLQPILDGYVNTMIIDIDNGDSVSSSLRLPEVLDPQKLIGATTYYRRASLQSLMSLQSIDDDGNEISATVKNTKPTITQERFENGLTKITNGEMTPEQFKQALSGYQLTDLQTKALLLL
jgi:hypothetical protein